MVEHPDFEWPYLISLLAYITGQSAGRSQILAAEIALNHPDHVEAWYSLARIHTITFELEEAQQALVHARSLYTDDDDASLGTIIECLTVMDEESKLACA